MDQVTITLDQAELDYVIRLIDNRLSFIRQYPDPFNLERDRVEVELNATISQRIKSQL